MPSIRLRLVVRLLLGLTIAVGAHTARVAGQDAPCDPYLKQPEGDPNGYRLRGDRCEGTYVREVAGSATLQVVSFSDSFASFEAGSGRDLLIEWPPFAESTVRLRAYPQRRRLYYRMDAIRPAGSRFYVWPSGLLAALRLSRSDIGLVAWSEYAVGGGRRDVLLPLKIRPRGDPVAPSALELAIQPAVELTEVFLSLAWAGQRGLSQVVLAKDEPLRYGYYPAERVVTIKLPKLKDPGLYHLEIGATLSRGGSSTAAAWFYHPGR